VTFEEFVASLPENSRVRYELHNGEIIEMAQPVGEHEEVKSLLAVEIPVEIKRQSYKPTTFSFTDSSYEQSLPAWAKSF
jgi:Uma2 family endonuclease